MKAKKQPKVLTNFRLTRDEITRLDRHARPLGLSRNKFVRKLIAELPAI